MQVWAQKRCFTRVQCLEALRGDGERQEVESLLIDYQGAEDSDYVRVVTRKSLCGGCGPRNESRIKVRHNFDASREAGLKEKYINCQARWQMAQR